jgi:hypothetical protein
MYIKETGGVGVDWVHLAQGSDHWRAGANSGYRKLRATR